MRQRAHRRAGFTLLEVVLAVGLTVLLAGAVYAFYELTLGVREDTRREGEVIFAQRRVMDLLARELESAMVYPFFMMGLKGECEQVTFMRTAVPSRAVYFSQGLLSFPDEWNSKSDRPGGFWEPEHDVQMVTYRLNRYEDEDGVEQVGGLERACLRTISAQVSEERVEEPGRGSGDLDTGPSRAEEEDGETLGVSAVRVRLLTDRVKFINLRYWDGAAWVESWAERELPLAVSIEIGTEPLPEDMLPEEYPYEKVTRVVAIPAGYRDTEAGMILEGDTSDFGGGAGR